MTSADASFSTVTTRDKPDPLLTVFQLGEREGLSERQVRDLIARKSLPHYRVNGIRVRLSEYLEWLAARRRVRRR